MEYNTSSTATLSRKFSNIHKSFNSTSIYDGVFTNTSKFGVSSSFSTRAEDYTEIFGGSRDSRRSSIPVLDIPVLHERKVSADVRSSKLDYFAIFGSDIESTVSYEDLLAKSNNSGTLSKEARTQAYGRARSEVSANSVDENELLSKEGTQISYDKVKSFDVSYNKVKPSSENGACGRTHIAQLHDVPGYTRLVEEARPSEREKSERAVANDTSTTSKADEGLLKSSGSKTFSDLPASSHNRTQTKEGTIRHKSSRTTSLSKDLLFDGYEFGLKIDGMHSPSNFSSNLNKDESDSGFGISPRSATEKFSGIYSPPDFGYEVDENSVAAASAAAVKKAIEIAEARIKLAKEIMEKEKEMFQGNMSYKGKVRKERRNGETAKEFNKSNEEKAKEEYECLNTKIQMMEAPGKVNSLDETLLDQDTGHSQRHISSSEAGQFTLEQGYKSIQEEQQESEDVAVVNGLNKAAITDKAVTSEAKQGFTMKNIIQSGYEFFARNWTRAADKPLQKSVEDTKSPMAVEEALSENEVEKEQPALKAWEEKLQSDRGRLKTENHEKKLESVQCHEEIAVMPTLLHGEGKHEEKLNVYNESALREDFQTSELEVQMKSVNGVPGLKENEFEQIDAHKGGKESGLRNMFDGEQARSPSEVSSAKEEDSEMQEEPYERVSCEAESEGTHFTEENKNDLYSSYSVVADNGTSLHTFWEQGELMEGSEEFPGGRKSSWLHIHSGLDDHNELSEGRINNDTSDELNSTEVTDQQETHEGFITERILTKIDIEIGKETRDSVDCQVDSIVTESYEQEILESEPRTSQVVECDRIKENVDVSINKVEERENIRKEDICLINLEGNEENLRKIADNHELDESCKSYLTNIAQNVLEVEKLHKQLKEENGALGFHENGIHVSSTKVHEAHQDDQSTEESPITGNEGTDDWDSPRMSNEEKHEHPLVADSVQSEICTNREEHGVVLVNGENLDDDLADGAICNDDDIYSEASDQPVFSGGVAKPNDLECFNDDRWVDNDDNVTFHIEEDQLSVLSERRGETTGIQHNSSSQSFEDVSLEGKEETLEFHFETNSQQSFEKDDLYVEESEQPALSERIEKAENLELIDDNEHVHDDDSNFHTEEDRLPVSSEMKNEMIGLQHETKSSQCFETVLSEGKEETVQFPSITNSRHSFEKNEENFLDTPRVEDGETDGSVQKEIKEEKNQDKKIDVSKERERAREMERLAVERAIREARERAFAEARERAERAAADKATAEARQRVMAHAREKLGKGSADVNTKLAEKKSMEAKLRAERAAVERATAEARERALEKAMSEKYSGAVKDNSVVQRFSSHDSRNNGSRPSISTRNQDPLDNNERSDEVKGESAERRKARLERHQRTAERAAKALAEKTMRDIIAQREQAERNRIAETLDADIRRWSGGKQGNLRALLSTLQYILGPDSGWQPVSLTEIITAAAVKKAYRKATLCVHPDKLQQRGATLQQKYVCEKVFDLLKEAWNKFSAEER